MPSHLYSYSSWLKEENLLKSCVTELLISGMQTFEALEPVLKK